MWDDNRFFEPLNDHSFASQVVTAREVQAATVVADTDAIAVTDVTAVTAQPLLSEEDQESRPTRIWGGPVRAEEVGVACGALCIVFGGGGLFGDNNMRDSVGLPLVSIGFFVVGVAWVAHCMRTTDCFSPGVHSPISGGSQESPVEGVSTAEYQLMQV